MNFNSFQRFVARILLISLCLQSCGGGFDNNPLIPTGEEQTASIQTNTQASIIPTDTQPILNKEFIAAGGNLVTFYEQDGRLQADIRVDEKQQKPNYKGLAVAIEEGIELASLVKLDPKTQQRRIKVNCKKGKIDLIEIFNGGLAGGGHKEKIIEKIQELQDGDEEAEHKLKKVHNILGISEKKAARICKYRKEIENLFEDAKKGEKAKDNLRKLLLLLGISKVKPEKTSKDGSSSNEEERESSSDDESTNDAVEERSNEKKREIDKSKKLKKGARKEEKYKKNKKVVASEGNRIKQVSISASVLKATRVAQRKTDTTRNILTAKYKSGNDLVYIVILSNGIGNTKVIDGIGNTKLIMPNGKKRGHSEGILYAVMLDEKINIVDRSGIFEKEVILLNKNIEYISSSNEPCSGEGSENCKNDIVPKIFKKIPQAAKFYYYNNYVAGQKIGAGTKFRTDTNTYWNSTERSQTYSEEASEVALYYVINDIPAEAKDRTDPTKRPILTAMTLRNYVKNNKKGGHNTATARTELKSIPLGRHPSAQNPKNRDGSFNKQFNKKERPTTKKKVQGDTNSSYSSAKGRKKSKKGEK